MEWQPIETAPKDGTEVLLYDDGEVAVVSWSTGSWRPTWCARAFGQYAIEHQSDFGTEYIETNTATHWMPLPDPPA